MDNEKVAKELRDRMKEAIEAAERITQAAETEDRGLNTDEDAQVKASLAEAERCKTELEGLARAVSARRQIEEAKQQVAVPDAVRQATSEPPARNDDGSVVVEVRENANAAYRKGDALAIVIGARVQYAAHEQQKAVRWAEKLYGTGSPHVRALQQSSFTAGGALIAENFVPDFIELLRARAMVRAAGATVVQFNGGSITLPKLASGPTPAVVPNEGDNLTTSEPTFGQLVLTEKKYGVVIPFSNDLRRNATLDAMRIVTTDLLRKAANDEDNLFLNGTGLNGEPKGVYQWVGTAGRTNSAGTALANVRTDIRVARNRLDNNNVPYERRAWFMHSRSANYMGWDLVDGNSNFAFPSLQNVNGASLGGDPVYRDNNISITLSTNQSQIFYGEMTEWIIADAPQMEIEIFENATYSQSGSLRSGISRDESVIRLIRKFDFGLRHDEAAHVLEAVTYGA